MIQVHELLKEDDIRWMLGEPPVDIRPYDAHKGDVRVRRWASKQASRVRAGAMTKEAKVLRRRASVRLRTVTRKTYRAMLRRVAGLAASPVQDRHTSPRRRS